MVLQVTGLGSPLPKPHLWAKTLVDILNWKRDRPILQTGTHRENKNKIKLKAKKNPPIQINEIPPKDKVPDILPCS
jgi:hypothetical protein